MALCINQGSAKAVKAFLKQVRKTGVGKDGISQQLENGAKLTAYNLHKEGMVRISYRATQPNNVKMIDIFEANIAKGKPKHTISEIASDAGNVLFWPGKKGFLGLGSKPSQVSVGNKDYTGKYCSEINAVLNSSATKAKTILRTTGEGLHERCIASVKELKEAIQKILNGERL